MDEVTTIGIDLAKNVFQVHGATTNGTVVFRKKLSRAQVLEFMSKQPACIVAMEACFSAHFWGRQFQAFGHDVRLIAPRYVKPFVKRQKNDMADAEAIAEAAARPTMRFVAVKSEAQQARGTLFRTREMFVNQRTRLMNAVRSHLAEFGIIAPQGRRQLKRLADGAGDTEMLPEAVRSIAQLYFEQIAMLTEKVAMLEKTIRQAAARAPDTARLQTMPGVGPISAMAIETFAPPMDTFRRGRDFSAWLGLVPRQFSSGGKPKLGRTSKMGQRDVRRLLISGAMSVIRWAKLKGDTTNVWLRRMLERKPRMLVAIALANKMARSVWAILTKQEDYRDPAPVPA